jgi:hypothetical protein
MTTHFRTVSCWMMHFLACIKFSTNVSACRVPPALTSSLFACTIWRFASRIRVSTLARRLSSTSVASIACFFTVGVYTLVTLMLAVAREAARTCLELAGYEMYATLARKGQRSRSETNASVRRHLCSALHSWSTPFVNSPLSGLNRKNSVGRCGPFTPKVVSSSLASSQDMSLPLCANSSTSTCTMRSTHAQQRSGRRLFPPQPSSCESLIVGGGRISPYVARHAASSNSNTMVSMRFGVVSSHLAHTLTPNKTRRCDSLVSTHTRHHLPVPNLNAVVVHSGHCAFRIPCEQKALPPHS